ncbi:MAG: Ig-like domain-containing protein, partial [candidate division KSB1 bacterium]|nr:Ig-like domain-containing protein [candidate division KSB1 bacterium]
MSKSYHFVKMPLMIVIYLLGLPLSTLGQFSVVSTIPADGATNVDTAITFQITFNAPLDTSARFDYPSGFFLSAAIHPDTLVGEPDSITLSPDLKTVYVHNPHLWPDTRYLLLIANAVSSTGDSLSIPYLVTFTTGSSLPTATVSGTVSYPGTDVTGTAVILFNAPLFAEEEVEADHATIVQTSAGNYTINYVSPGTYWPVAVKDFIITADGGLEPKVGGGLGFYDMDTNGVPDSIVISEGQQMSGIDISLFSLTPVTARHNYPTVADSAQNWASDAVLVQLGTPDISPAGEAMIWMYAFYSPTVAAYRAWVSMGTLVMPMELEEPPEATTALPANWLDSDV